MKITYALALTGMLAFSGSAFAASSTTATTNANTIAKPAAAATADTAKPAAPTAAKPAVADTQKQAISKKCSADADAKGLHGKDRKKFREQCKTAAMKKS